MAYLIYNLTYNGKPFDFDVRTKDHRQAIVEAVSTVLDEMGLGNKDLGHQSRYQIATARDIFLMTSILPGINLTLVETISDIEEHQLDWALKLLAEYDRRADPYKTLPAVEQATLLELSQNSHSLRKFLDRRFSSTYHLQAQEYKDECMVELDVVLRQGWAIMAKIEGRPLPGQK